MKQFSDKVVVVGFLSLICAVLSLSFALVKNPAFLGSFVGPGFNVIDTVTHTATSTDGVLPMKLLEENTSRLNAVIQNDSDTALYIFFQEFASNIAASTTVLVNTGIRVNANGGEYVIKPENLYTGQVWATSTAGSKNILITEK